MTFVCNHCNYSTDIKCNYMRHLNSVAHLQNIDKKPMETANDKKSVNYKCECGKIYANRSGLFKHKKTCEKNNINKDDLFVLFKAFMNQQSQMNSLFMEYVKNNKPSTTNSHNTTYNVSVKNYLQHNYPDAPALIELDDYSKIKYDQTNKNNHSEEEENNDRENDEFVENLVYNYNHTHLHKYLGDFIIQYYKKDNPAEQSMWTSDVSRLTYIIKELLKNNKSVWNHDYKGTKTKTYIIDPLLKYIKKYMDDYWIKHIDDCKKTNVEKLNKYNKIYTSIYKIKQDINNGVLGNDIIRHVAPYFSMNKKDEITQTSCFIDDEDEDNEDNEDNVPYFIDK